MRKKLFYLAAPLVLAVVALAGQLSPMEAALGVQPQDECENQCIAEYDNCRFTLGRPTRECTHELNACKKECRDFEGGRGKRPPK